MEGDFEGARSSLNTWGLHLPCGEEGVACGEEGEEEGACGEVPCGGALPASVPSEEAGPYLIWNNAEKNE